MEGKGWCAFLETRKIVHFSYKLCSFNKTAFTQSQYSSFTGSHREVVKEMIFRTLRFSSKNIALQISKIHSQTFKS